MLLTGARGQLGSELQRHLAPVVDIAAFGREELDLSAVEDIRRCVRSIRPALIINTAAYTAVDDAEREPDAARAVNAIAPGVLAAEGTRIGAAIIHFSTDYVFDGEKGAPYTERDAPEPLGVYGRTKLAGEHAVAASTRAHLILRTSWVYGMRGRTFLSRIVRRTDLPSELRLVCDQLSVPTWVGGLASATASIVSRLTTGASDIHDSVAALSGVYHLSSAGGGASPYEFAEAALSTGPAGGSEEPRLMPAFSADIFAAARRPRDSRLDSSLAEAVFGVRIEDWRQQLARALSEG